MSDRETVDFLATVPLLEGREEADLVGAGAGDAPADGAGGRGPLAPGGRGAGDGCSSSTAPSRPRCACPAIARWRSARAGPGEMVGEIALLDGGAHTMSVRATETATVLALGRLDFAALLARQHPSAFSLKRRLAVALHRAPSRPARGTSPARSAARRPARRPRTRHGRSPSWSTAARPTASTCVAWRPSTTSIRWRSGAS